MEANTIEDTVKSKTGISSEPIGLPVPSASEEIVGVQGDQPHIATERPSSALRTAPLQEVPTFIPNQDSTPSSSPEGLGPSKVNDGSEAESAATAKCADGGLASEKFPSIIEEFVGVHGDQTLITIEESSSALRTGVVQEEPALFSNRDSIHLNPTERPGLPAVNDGSGTESATTSGSGDGGVANPIPLERYIIVGVDFGTSTTKVVWQDLRDNHFEVFRWDCTSGGLGTTLLPSTVTFRGEFIYFGTADSDLVDGDIRLRSIKLCILCQGRHEICRCGNSVARSGTIRVPWFADAQPATAIASLFLAFVFGEVERGLQKRFPKDSLTLVWNVGCPMDHIDVEDRKAEWERMTGAALGFREKAGNPTNGGRIREIREVIERTEVPPESIRNYFVQPEGLAGVKAFLESPHAEVRTYAIVDVGAGTTEVSLFFNSPETTTYLADSTEAIGGGNIDLDLANALGCDIDTARQKKEEGMRNWPNLPTVDSICKQYRKACGTIVLQRLLTAPANMRFDLFVIGGGGKPDVVRTRLENTPLLGNFVRERTLKLEPPLELRDRDLLQSEFDFLATACGLASSLSWEYFPPRDVTPMAARRENPLRDLGGFYGET